MTRGASSACTEAYDQILLKYFEAKETGGSVRHSDWLERYPDYASQLREFFAAEVSLLNVGFPAPSVPSDKIVGQPPAAHDIIGGLRVKGEIARGGMGVVLKARDEQLECDFAIKLVLAGRFASKADRERFQREAKSAAQLKHPQIVRVRDFGHHQGYPYLVMDYVAGESLADRIKRGSLSPIAAAELVLSLSSAVAYAHQRGLVHRDLKPGNVLLDNEGNPHLTDFGLAKVIQDSAQPSVDSLTESGQILGTPGYMAPEQAAAKHSLVDQRSDIYSLGALLYACLVGRAPFVADSPIETLQQVIDDDPIPIRQWNPKTPVDLETIGLKCLQKDCQQRYQTVPELQEDLRRFLGGQPIRARRMSPMERIWRWRRQNRAVFSLGLITLATMLFCLLWIESLARQTRWELFQSRQSEARVLSQSRSTGQRFAALDALERAGQLNSSQDLFSWGMYALTRPDLGNETTFLLGLEEAQCLATSSDGKTAVTQTRDGAVSVVQPGTAHALDLIRTRGRLRESDVKLSSDGRWVAIREDGLFNIWDSRSGRLVQSSLGPTLAFSGQSNQVLSIDRFGLASLRSLVTGKVYQTQVGSNADAVSFGPHDRRVAIAYGGRQCRLELFEIRTDRLGSVDELVDPFVRAGNPVFRKGFHRGLLLTWHPDGVHLAITQPGQGVAVCDTQVMKIVRYLSMVADSRMAKFSPDGDYLVTANSDGYLRFWDYHSGEEMLKVAGSSPMGFGGERAFHWVSEEGLISKSFAGSDFLDPIIEGKFEEVAYRDPGLLIAWGSQGTCTLALSSPKPVISIGIPDSGLVLVGYDANFLPFSKSSRQLLALGTRVFCGRELTGIVFASTCAINRRLLQNSELAALAGSDGQGMLKTDGDELLAPNRRSNWINFATCRKQNLLAISSPEASGDITVSVQATGRVLKTLNFQGPAAPHFSPAGNLLAVVHPAGIDLLDTATWENVAAIHSALGTQRKHGEVLFDPARNRMAFQSDRGELTFWNLDNQEVEYRIPNLDQRLLRFSADGKRLIVSLNRLGNEILAEWNLAEAERRLVDLGR